MEMRCHLYEFLQLFIITRYISKNPFLLKTTLFAERHVSEFFYIEERESFFFLARILQCH